jgi:hypothetical protein
VPAWPPGKLPGLALNPAKLAEGMGRSDVSASGCCRRLLDLRYLDFAPCQRMIQVREGTRQLAEQRNSTKFSTRINLSCSDRRPYSGRRGCEQKDSSGKGAVERK